METKYTITQYDNGWTMEDDRSMGRQVVQEKNTDKTHKKFKLSLGEWLYEDMEEFMQTNGEPACVIELKIRNARDDE